MKKTLVGSYCPRCDEVCLSYQELDDIAGQRDTIDCPRCSADIDNNHQGTWNEVEVPEPPVEARPHKYSRDVFHRLSRLASRVDTLERTRNQPPFQRVVNHEPEHARRIEGLERRERMLQAQVVSNNERLNGELADHEELWETLDKRIADLGETVEKQGQWCTVLQTRLDASDAINEGLLKRLEKFEAENSVVTGRVVTRDPELQNQFTKLEKKIEPLQGWMDGVAEKIRGLNTKIDVSVMRIDALAEDHEEGVKQIRDINTRVRGLETSSVHNESPLNRITRLENGRKVLMDRVEGLKETFDGAYTNAMSKVEELEWAFEKLKKLEGWKADARVNMLEGEVGGAAEERAELSGRVTGLEATTNRHKERIDGIDHHYGVRLSKLEERICRIEEKKTSVPMSVLADLRVLKERVDQLANKLPMKGAAAATDHVDAVAQEIRKLNQRVEDLAKTPDFETELRTKLSQHVKQSDSGYEELDLRVSKLEERRPLFDEHVERCHDFEVDIRDRIQKLDDRLVDVEPNGEAIETLGAYLEEQLKGLRQDLADLECRAIRVGAVEEAHGALAGQFERLVAKLDQYPEMTIQTAEQARELKHRVSKLETMSGEHLLRRIERDDCIEKQAFERFEEVEKQFTDRIDGIELRLANAETSVAGHCEDLVRVEGLAKRANEEEFAQGAVEGFTARFEKVDQQLEDMQGASQRLRKVEDRIAELTSEQTHLRQVLEAIQEE